MDVCKLRQYRTAGTNLFIRILNKENYVLNDAQKARAVGFALLTAGSTRHQEAKEETKEKIAELKKKKKYKEGLDTAEALFKDFRPAPKDKNKDLRYLILKSSKWSDEEKKKLMNQFWPNPADYEESLDRWELDILLRADLAKHIRDHEFMARKKYFIYSKEALSIHTGSVEKGQAFSDELATCEKINELRHPTELQSIYMYDRELATYCRHIDEAMEACGFPLIKGQKETDEEHQRFMQAKEYYKTHFESDPENFELANAAEICGAEYARLFFSRMVANRFIESDPLHIEKVPIINREKMLAKIFFFAKRTELIKKSLIDYSSAVLDSDVLSILGTAYGDNSNEFYTKMLAKLDEKKPALTEFMKVKRRKPPKKKEDE